MITSSDPFIEAIGATDVVMTEWVITSCDGISVEEANRRLQICLRQEHSIAAAAWAHQVRVWMIRRGIPLSSVPQMIAAVTAEGVERDEAMARWEYAVKIPKDHPLVSALAAQLNLDLETIWWEILAI